VVTRRIGSDTCPVLDTEQDRFTLEIEGPVNGGRNSDGPKVDLLITEYASLSKTKLYAGNSSKTPQYSYAWEGNIPPPWNKVKI